MATLQVLRAHHFSKVLRAPRDVNMQSKVYKLKIQGQELATVLLKNNERTTPGKLRISLLSL